MDTSEANQLRDTFGKIVGCIQQGKPTEPEALAQQILRDHPNEPNRVRVLGVALMRQGKFEEASKHLSTSAKVPQRLRIADSSWMCAFGRDQAVDTCTDDSDVLRGFCH